MIVGLLAGALAPLETAFASAPTGTAPDGPGAASYFDLARKDCLGTARNTTSKVWYTVAGGVLSDVYYPTDDNTNVKTLQFIVTDGSGFTDLQERDTTYTVSNPDPRSLDCRVTTTAKSGKYRIVTDYLADPTRNSVLMQVHFVPLVGDLSQYQLYVRYNPLLNGNGGGVSANVGGDTAGVDTSTGHPIPVAADTNTHTNASNRDYAVPVYSALDASTPFSAVTSGFAGGTSDGLTQLDASHQLTAFYANAVNGDIAQTAQVPLTRGGQFVLALGFGTTQAQAVGAAEGSLGARFGDLQRQYDEGWHAYDAGLNAPPTHFAGVAGNDWHALVDQYYFSANVIKAS
jgi:GH15 family glucan-1,4-alpha-glucosidase